MYRGVSVNTCTVPFVLGPYVKLHDSSVKNVISVLQHGGTRLPLDRFSRNFEFFIPKNSLKYLSLIKICNNKGKFDGDLCIL